MLVLRCMLSNSRSAASRPSEWKLPKVPGRLRSTSCARLPEALDSSWVAHCRRVIALSKMELSGPP